MTRSPGSHLSADEIDACLIGVPTPEIQRHLDQCSQCLEQVKIDREIAEQVAWLASERNTYVTGQVLTVDGGLTVTF